MMRFLDRLLSRKNGKKNKAQEQISYYELHVGARGIRFKKVRTFKEKVEFEDLEDAMPGWTYRLCTRSKRGRLFTIWNQRVPGPPPVEGRSADPLAHYMAAIEPILKFGTQITVLRESIRAAFGWALPQGSEGGNAPTSPRYKGSLPAILHPKAPELAMAWSPFVRDMSEAITSGIREGLAAIKSEGEAKPEGGKRLGRPPPDPDDYL